MGYKSNFRFIDICKINISHYLKYIKMRKKIKFTTVLMLIMFFYGTGIAQFKFSGDIVNNRDNQIIVGNDTSEVNWTTQYIEAKGWSVMDTSRFKIPGQAKAMAKRGAIVDAQRNLLERIEGIRIVGETIVKDMVTQKDYIYTRLEGVLKGAELIGDISIEDNIVEVRMRVPIYERDGEASVAEVVQEAMDIKPIFVNEKDAPIDKNEQMIGFNINGEIIDPALFPQIIDENGNVVLDLSKYYNGKNGKFPQYLKMSRDIINSVGFKEGVKIIDLVQDSEGKFKVDLDKLSSGSKIDWKKIGRIATQIGSVIIKLVL